MLFDVAERLFHEYLEVRYPPQETIPNKLMVGTMTTMVIRYAGSPHCIYEPVFITICKQLSRGSIVPCVCLGYWGDPFPPLLCLLVLCCFTLQQGQCRHDH